MMNITTEGAINLIEAMVKQAEEDVKKADKKNPTQEDLALANEANEWLQNLRKLFS